MSAIQSEKKRVRFLLLGTVEPRKGQQTFVRAVRELPRDVREGSEFLIVGRPHDARLAEEVRAAAKSVSHLHYKESMPHANAMELIRGADVMVCTSRDETGPLTLIEGMALGKPILSKIVADRAGHAMHTALVSRILRDKTMWEEVTLAEAESDGHSRYASQASAGSSL